MKIAWINFLSATQEFLAKRLLIAAGACLIFGLLATPPVHAQVIHGTAGFETGLQLLAGNIQKPYSDVTVDWGDGGPTTAGLVQIVGGIDAGPIKNIGATYNVYGTHLYAKDGSYGVQISYQYCSPLCVTNPINNQTFGLNNATVSTTASISKPGNFVILSIGDSIASGEGNPVVPNSNNTPNWAFWDDAYSSGDNPAYSSPGEQFTCSFDFLGFCHIPVPPFICGPPIATIVGGICTFPGSSPFPPDEQAEWPHQSFPCHRSSYAGPAQAANMLVANNPGSDITFINFACAGAVIEPGHTASTWTQDVVGQLKIARERLAQSGAGIDILLISAGANDLYGPNTFGNGFGGLLTYCLNLDPTNQHLHCDVDNLMQGEVIDSLNQLPGSYKNLAMEINCHQPPPFTGANGVQQDPDPSCTNPQKQIPKLVLITEYMDPTHDETGAFPSGVLGRAKCPAAFQNFDFADGGDFKFFKNGVVNPLNDAVIGFPADAQSAGLTAPTYAVTGIGGSDVPGDGDDFSNHGVCAGGQRWVYGGFDSRTLLGTGPPPNGTYPGQSVNLKIPLDSLGITSITVSDNEQFNGMLHPNTATLAAQLLPDSFEGFFTTLFTTRCTACGQEDYRDRIFQAIVNDNPPVTTATTTNGVGGAVVVTLTASNAISESGVGSTFYAVDNANCSPGATGNCTVVTAPFTFTISTSGQHTLTFFSSNAASQFEASQSMQVSVNNNNNNSLTITANASRQYGAADPPFTPSYNGFVNGDTSSVLTGTLTCTSTDTPTSPVGNYSINCSGLSSSTYNITYVPGTLMVTQAPLAITPNNATMQYGQSIPAFTGTIAGLQNGDNITANYSTSATPASSIGSYAITPMLADQGGKLGNYAVTVNTGTLTVTTAPLTVTSNNASRVYGAANPVFTGTITGLLNGDSFNANYATIATPASPAGNYTITPTLVDSGGKLGNYAVTLNSGTLTVTVAPLIITANPASRQYGAADPAFAVSYSGFVNGDTSAVLNGTPLCTAGDTVASSVGTYAVNCSGPSSPNYSITFVPGVLTITTVPLTVTSNNASRVYGAANPVFTGTIAGLQNADNIIANYATSATPASPLGNYAITPTLVDLGGKLGNYAVTLNNGTLTVTAEPLMVTVTNASRQYGQANPAFAGTIAGLQNGDNITANYSTSATPASPVGNYAITPSLADPGGKLGNYAVTLNNGTLAVTAAPLAITANNATRGYGQPNPPFGPSYSGFVNGENASVLAGTLSCSSPATPSSPVAGSPYAISCSGLTSSNYAITYLAGALTVTAAPLTITANSATKILNAPLPAFGASYSGFVNGEGPSILIGSLSCTTTATATSPVGSYPITCSGLTAANYAVAWAAGTLKVMYTPAGVCGHVILPPIDPAGNTVGNQGRTIPAKFQVCDANGVSIGTPGVVTGFLLTQIITGTATTNVEDIVDTNNPDSAFHWDGTEWIYNITTQNLAAGSTYVYTIMLNDGSTIVFQFGLR